MTKEALLLQKAKQLAKAAGTWADLSNALFDPETGILAKAYRDAKERDAFTKTPEYRQIRELIHDAQDRTGFVEGATPSRSGRFLLRLPKSLHAALVREAVAEGVSLNQLVVTKLAVQLNKVAG
jgi:hypothetical protein